MKIFTLFVSLILCVSYSTAQIITGTYYFGQSVGFGFDFSSGRYCASNSDSADIVFQLVEETLIYGEIIDMGNVPFDSIREAPAEGYQDTSYVMYDHLFVIRTKEHYYAKMDVFYWQPDPLGSGFLWAYQSDGSTNLRTSTIVENTRQDGYKARNFELLQNYPNPFNSFTTFIVNLPENNYISLQLFDLKGRLIKTLVSGDKEDSIYLFRWDGRNEISEVATSGLYLCVLRTKANIASKKVLFLK